MKFAKPPISFENVGFGQVPTASGLGMMRFKMLTASYGLQEVYS